MNLGIAGHRPDKLGGYRPNTINQGVRELLRESIIALEPELIITGMALGTDLWAAEIASDLGVPCYAMVPFYGQHLTWPKVHQAQYELLLNGAEFVEFCSPPPAKDSPRRSAVQAMFARNTRLVKESDELLILLRKSAESERFSGTYDTFLKAVQAGKPVTRFPLGIFGLD